MAFMTIVVLSVFILGVISAFILIFIGSFVLQGFLSNMKNPWAGLILPVSAFIFILFLSILVVTSYDFSAALVLMVKGNICTVIYLLIYFFFRRRRKKLNSTSQINITK